MKKRKLKQKIALFGVFLMLVTTIIPSPFTMIANASGIMAAGTKFVNEYIALTDTNIFSVSSAEDINDSINQELETAISNYAPQLTLDDVLKASIEHSDSSLILAKTSALEYPHNFTTQDTTSSFFTFPGTKNLSSIKGTVTYNDLVLTQCLKLETGTQIVFTAPTNGNFTMVFNPQNGAVNIKVNGTKITGDATTGIITIQVLAGTTYTLEKADTANLFYMSLVIGNTTPTVTPTVKPTTTPTGTPTPTVKPTTTPTPPAQVDGDIYVAPNGSQSGQGTYNDPMGFTSALTKIKAGKTIWMLPGTYNFSETIVVEKSNSGSAGAYKTISKYGGNVTFNFSGQALSTSNRGVVQAGNYWKWYGIDIKGAGDNGMLLSGNYNIIELCQFYENRDSGLQLSRFDTSASSISQWPSYNLIKNCTAFNNSDVTGENADGFAAKLTCGEGNVFDGCMAYNNSDDGWDLYAKSDTGPIGVVTIRNSIAFRNGKLTNGSGSASGDMNGFKLGGSGVGTPHIIENSMAFENGAHGFTDNNNPSAIKFKNITSFNNSIYSGSNKANFQINRANGPSVYNAIGISTNTIATDKITSAIGSRIIYMNGGKYYEYEGAVGSAFDTDNKVGTVITPVASNIFVSTTAPNTSTNFHTVWRNSDGSINTGGFLQIKSSSKYATFSTEGKEIGAVFK
jgi:hypothetical protein